MAAAALLLVVLAAPAHAQEDDGGWVIDDFSVAIEIQPDGSLRVTEEISVDFDDLERHGIFRVIPTKYAVSAGDTQVELPPDRTAEDYRRLVPIDDITVSSTAPNDLDVSDLGNALRLRIGDEDVTVTGPQTYRISYTATGALNSYEGYDELYWNATGDDWPVPIMSAAAVVTAPAISQAACFRGTQASTRACEAQTSGREAVFSSQMMWSGEGMTLAVALPTGSVEVPPPILEARYHFGRALTGSPLAWPLAALAALLGFGGVGVLAYRQGRDRVSRGGVTVDGRLDHDRPARRPLFPPRSAPVGYRPPEDLRPAQLGLIVDERVEGVEVSATIVDLAVRGHLIIQEVADTRNEWLLRKVGGPAPDSVLPFERKLLEGLFADGDEVNLKDLKGEFSSDYQAVQGLVYEDGVKRGWFPRNPRGTRASWLWRGFGALVVAGAVGFVLLRFTEVGIAAVPLVLAALALVVAHRLMPHRTPKGSRLLTETRGFAEFIRTAETERMEFAEEERIFERYLPYAIVFGAVDRWARAFAALGVAGTAGAFGGWYVGHGGALDFDGLSKGLSSFSHEVGTDLSTAPSSSGSGGGGFSGGGFGGGGGGSW